MVYGVANPLLVYGFCEENDDRLLNEDDLYNFQGVRIEYQSVCRNVYYEPYYCILCEMSPEGTIKIKDENALKELIRLHSILEKRGEHVTDMCYTLCVYVQNIEGGDERTIYFLNDAENDSTDDSNDDSEDV